MLHNSTILSSVILCLIISALILQILSLCSAHWAIFIARTDLGKPAEHGHYGIWTLCTIKSPIYVRVCNPLDTFFEAPRFLGVSGVLAIIHIVLLVILIILAVVRLIQVRRNIHRLLLHPRHLCIAKLSIAFISVMLAILVAIFASIGENRNKEYAVKKAWSFWVQISAAAADFILTAFCAIQNFSVWRHYFRESADPTGQRAETYTNGAFDNTDSPPRSRGRKRDSANETIVAFTEESGRPNPKGTSKFGPFRFRTQNDPLKFSGIITYENPFYQQQSPDLPRRNN